MGRVTKNQAPSFNHMGHPGRAKSDIAIMGATATITMASVASVANVAPAIVAHGDAAALVRPGGDPTAQRAANRMARPGRSGLALVAQKVQAAHSLDHRGCADAAAGGVASSGKRHLMAHGATGRVGASMATGMAPGAMKRTGGAARVADASVPRLARSSARRGRAARGGSDLGRHRGRGGMIVTRNRLDRLVRLVQGARLGRPGRVVAAGAGFPVGHGVAPHGAARKDGVLVWDDALAALGRGCSSAVA